MKACPHQDFLDSGTPVRGFEKSYTDNFAEVHE